MKKIISLSLFIISLNTFAMESKTLHWGVNLEPTEYFEIAALRFKKNVEVRTNNRVKVKLTIGKYKQDERDHLKDVETNKYQMGQEVINNLVDKVPALAIWELPYLFENDEHVFSYTSSKIAKNHLATLTKSTKVKAIEYTYSGGFMYMFGDKLNDLADLAGKDLYVESSTGEYMSTLKHKLKLSHVKDYDSSIIQKKSINSELISSVLEELYRIPAKRELYLNLTQHRVFARIIFLNKDFLESLNKEDKEIVLDEAQRAAIFERSLSLEASRHHLENIASNHPHIKINKWSPKKRNALRTLFSSEYKSYENNLVRTLPIKLLI